MTLSAVGEMHDYATELLSPDWYKKLNKTQLAAYVRHAYIWRQNGAVDLESAQQKKRVTRWDGGEDSFGCKFTAVWPRIVKAIASYDANPGVWVAAHFSHIALAKRINGKASFDARDISPSELCSQDSHNIYADYCAQIPKLIREEYQIAGRTINLRLRSLERLNLEKADQYLCVICDEGYVTASPFFRHGFADIFKAHSAADRYLLPAAFDYEARQPLYDAAIDGVCQWCITKQLTQTVVTIRSQWRRVK